jgi:hypothetical protein
MKKMFLALAAASLVSTMAFAQDDYDYGDDYGTEASTSSDDGYTDMDSGDKATAEEKPASDVEYKNMDEGKKVSRDEGTKPAFFDRPFNMAAHIALGYGSFWSTPDQYDNAAWRQAYGMDSNPYDEWLGYSVAFGMAFNYRIMDILSVSPEFNLGIRGFIRNLDSYYSYWYDTYVEVNEDIFMFDIELPILLRVMPTHQIYFEAGPQFTLKLVANHSVDYVDSYTDETIYSDAKGSWECATFFASLVIGGGATLDLDGKLFDIGLRFIMDMTKLEKDDTEMPDLDGSTFKDETKMWTLQLVVKYWF